MSSSIHQLPRGEGVYACGYCLGLFDECDMGTEVNKCKNCMPAPTQLDRIEDRLKWNTQMLEELMARYWGATVPFEDRPGFPKAVRPKS